MNTPADYQQAQLVITIDLLVPATFDRGAFLKRLQRNKISLSASDKISPSVLGKFCVDVHGCLPHNVAVGLAKASVIDPPESV